MFYRNDKLTIRYLVLCHSKHNAEMLLSFISIKKISKIHHLHGDFIADLFPFLNISEIQHGDEAMRLFLPKHGKELVNRNNLKSLGTLIPNKFVLQFLDENVHIKKIKVLIRYSDNDDVINTYSKNPFEYFLMKFPCLEKLNLLFNRFSDVNELGKFFNYLLEDNRMLKKFKIKNLGVFQEFYELKKENIIKDLLNVNKIVEKLVLKDQWIEEGEFIKFTKFPKLKIIKTCMRYTDKIMTALEGVNKKLKRTLVLLSYQI